MPKYRGIEYNLLQGIRPRSWRWEIVLPQEGTKAGQSPSKLDAIRAAERTIERTLNPPKKRLVPPEGNRPH